MCAIEWPALWLCKWGPEPPDAFSRRFPVIRINQLSRLCLSFFFFHFISLFYSIFFPPHTSFVNTSTCSDFLAPGTSFAYPILSGMLSGMLGDARGCSGIASASFDAMHISTWRPWDAKVAMVLICIFGMPGILVRVSCRSWIRKLDSPPDWHGRGNQRPGWRPIGKRGHVPLRDGRSH